MLASSTLTTVVSAYQEPLEENIVLDDVEEKIQQSDELTDSQDNQAKVIQRVEISVFEGIGMKTNKQTDDKVNNENIEKIQQHVDIHVFEGIHFKSDKFEKNLALQKEFSDKKAIMEKIWNTERIRFTGKSFVVEDQFGNQHESLIDESYELTDQTIQELALDYYPTRNLPTLSSNLVQQQSSLIPIMLVDANGSSVISFKDISNAIEQGVVMCWIVI